MQEMKVPLWEKVMLTIKEAVELFNIGETRLRQIVNTPNFEAVVVNGNKTLIKRKAFEKWLDGERFI